MDREERFRRRQELARGFEEQIRAAYATTQAAKMSRPVAIVAEGTEAWGEALLRGMAGGTPGPAAFVYPADEVLKTFTNIDPALGKMPMELLDAVRNVEEGTLCIVCLAYTGWSVFYPDSPGGWGAPQVGSMRPQSN
jgi:hypothetical protein